METIKFYIWLHKAKKWSKKLWKTILEESKECK